MAAGLTVWLDPNGGTDEGYGVRYPVPPDFADLGTIRGSVAGRSGPSGTGASSSFDERLRQAELIGPGERGVRRVPLPIGGGFDVAAQFNGPTLVYELRVPLARDRDARMGLGVAPGTRIGVGFATGNLRDLIGGGMRFPGRPGSFGGGIGGLGGTGRGGPGRTIGGRRGGGPEQSDPLELWARVDLASPQ